MCGYDAESFRVTIHAGRDGVSKGSRTSTEEWPELHDAIYFAATAFCPEAPTFRIDFALALMWVFLENVDPDELENAAVREAYNRFCDATSELDAAINPDKPEVAP